MTIEAALRHQLTAEPMDILRRLPLMGRVMMVAKDDAATHERIGEVERLETEGNQLFCLGVDHDCEIDLSLVTSAIVDRSGRMKDKELPKIEFTNAGGDAIFSVIVLDGIEKFDYAMSPFTGIPLPAAVKATPATATLAANDVGLLPLEAARKAESEIVIEMNLAGVRQRWTGLVPDINPAMGFINVMTKDFHLHLRGGSVGRWQRNATGPGELELVAMTQAGEATGLVLRGPSGAFGEAL